jgi:hypothetical protein
MLNMATTYAEGITQSIIFDMIFIVNIGDIYGIRGNVCMGHKELVNRWKDTMDAKC